MHPDDLGDLRRRHPLARRGARGLAAARVVRGQDAGACRRSHPPQIEAAHGGGRRRGRGRGAARSARSPPPARDVAVAAAATVVAGSGAVVVVAPFAADVEGVAVEGVATWTTTGGGDAAGRMKMTTAAVMPRRPAATTMAIAIHGGPVRGGGGTLGASSGATKGDAMGAGVIAGAGAGANAAGAGRGGGGAANGSGTIAGPETSRSRRAPAVAAGGRRLREPLGRGQARRERGKTLLRAGGGGPPGRAAACGRARDGRGRGRPRRRRTRGRRRGRRHACFRRGRRHRRAPGGDRLANDRRELRERAERAPLVQPLLPAEGLLGDGADRGLAPHLRDADGTHRDAVDGDVPLVARRQVGHVDRRRDLFVALALHVRAEGARQRTRGLVGGTGGRTRGREARRERSAPRGIGRGAPSPRGRPRGRTVAPRARGPR